MLMYKLCLYFASYCCTGQDNEQENEPEEKEPELHRKITNSAVVMLKVGVERLHPFSTKKSSLDHLSCSLLFTWVNCTVPGVLLYGRMRSA